MLSRDCCSSQPSFLRLGDCRPVACSVWPEAMLDLPLPEEALIEGVIGSFETSGLCSDD